MPTDLDDGLVGVVVIPACNEQATIARTLSVLLGDARPGELRTVVVCNGCSDDTAEVARSVALDLGQPVTVLEQPEANKASALRSVERLDLPFPRLYLDADVDCPTGTARRLLDAVRSGHALAVPTRRLDLAAASRPAAAYYRTWQSLPWVQAQLAGRGCYAVGEALRKTVERLPDVVAEDRLVTTRPLGGGAVLIEAAVTIRPPARLADVVRVRSRVYGGNIVVDAPTHDEPVGSRLLVLARAALRPSRWFGLAVFAGTTAVAKARAAYLVRSGGVGWARAGARDLGGGTTGAPHRQEAAAPGSGAPA